MRLPAGAAFVAALLPLPGAAVQFETYTDRQAFEARLGAVQVIDFDDIDTSQQDPVAFEADRYLAAAGATIESLTQEGQYVSRGFGFPDFNPTSPPNLYSPGPISDLTGTNTTTVVAFFADGAPALVAGFGAVFIDADFPDFGPSSLAVLDGLEQVLFEIGPISGGNGSRLFRGVVAVDEGTSEPVAVIESARLVSGSEWPPVDVAEGVSLDDFVFATPVPEPARPLLLASGLATLALARRPGRPRPLGTGAGPERPRRA